MNPHVGEIYLTHFEAALGQVIDRSVFRMREDLPSIQVLEFSPGVPGCRTFVTLGLSNYSGSVGGRIEVIMPVEGRCDNVPRILAESCFAIVQDGIQLRKGVRLGGLRQIAPEFAAVHGKDGVYFTQPFGCPADFERVTCDGGDGRVLLALLITESELEFLEAKGAREFESAMEDAHIDPLVADRVSMV